MARKFFSCLLDDTHLYRAIRYVERNPVRAEIVENPWDYEWSSAKEHIGIERGLIPLSETFYIKPSDWIDYLKETDEEMVNDIRLKTQRGLAVGTKGFIQIIGNKIKRSLICLNPGRPRKKR